MTKNDLIKQAKLENPALLFKVENDVTIELTLEEYDEAINNWAEMRLAQIKLENELAEKEIQRNALLSKLGITQEEAKLLLG